MVDIEADALYIDFGRSQNHYTNIVGALNPDLTPVNPSGLPVLDYFGTLRGRLGCAFHRTLTYGTGVFAYCRTTNTAFRINIPYAVAVSGYSHRREDEFAVVRAGLGVRAC